MKNKNKKTVLNLARNQCSSYIIATGAQGGNVPLCDAEKLKTLVGNGTGDGTSGHARWTVTPMFGDFTVGGNIARRGQKVMLDLPDLKHLSSMGVIVETAPDKLVEAVDKDEVGIAEGRIANGEGRHVVDENGDTCENEKPNKSDKSDKSDDGEKKKK